MNSGKRSYRFWASAIFLLFILSPWSAKAESQVAVPSDELVCGAGLGGQVKGVEFSNSQAHNVLVFLNSATREEMELISNISLLRALRVEEARARKMIRQCQLWGSADCKKRRAELGFTSLLEILLINSIGPQVIKSLKEEVEKNWCLTHRSKCCY